MPQGKTVQASRKKGRGSSANIKPVHKKAQRKGRAPKQRTETKTKKFVETKHKSIGRDRNVTVAINNNIEDIMKARLIHGGQRLTFLQAPKDVKSYIFSDIGPRRGKKSAVDIHTTAGKRRAKAMSGGPAERKNRMQSAFVQGVHAAKKAKVARKRGQEWDGTGYQSKAAKKNEDAGLEAIWKS
jgi:hypothetical protein